VAGVTRPAERRRTEHSLDERIAAAQLAPSEASVARFLSEHRDEVIFMSVAEIAAATGAGAATVVRTAQRLGYRGLPELKRDMRASLSERIRPAQRLARSLGEIDPDESVLEHVLAFQIEQLTDAIATLRGADFDRAVRLLRDSDRVVTVSGPPTEGIVAYFARVLRRFGRRVLEASFSDTEPLLELGKGDVLVVVAYQKADPQLRGILAHARDMRVPTILVSDALALALKGRYDVALTARRGNILEYPTAVTVLAVLEALVIGLGAQDRRHAITLVERATALRDQLKAP
jgi:DNA-binding MurR/RpiR family transcriptional regulator